MVVAHSIGCTLCYDFEYAYLNFEILVHQHLSRLTCTLPRNLHGNVSMYMEKSHEVKYVIQIYIFMPIIAYYMSIGGQYLQNMLVV